MKHVLEPVQPPYDPEVADILSRYPQGKDGYILRLFRVFANSRRFLTRKGVVNLLDEQSPISLREREIVILRVTANNDCEYEWGIHVSTFARAAALTPVQVAATRTGDPESACWTPEEALLIRCVDDLCAHARIRNDAYGRFQETWNLEQQLEILALSGNYHTICFVANTARLANEDRGARFSAAS